MLFDALCKIVERNLPEEIPMLKAARIFRLEREASEAGNSVFDWEPEECTIENFRLPYETIAIEHVSEREKRGDASVVFREAAGRRLRFLGYIQASNYSHVFRGEMTALPDESIEECHLGRVAKLHSMSRWNFDGTRLHAVPARLNETHVELTRKPTGDKNLDEANRLAKLSLNGVEIPREELDRVIGELCSDIHKKQKFINDLETGMICMGLMNATTSVLIINEPARFIVEETPILKREPDGRKLTRSIYRPHYIVLRPRQIRKLLCLQEPCGEENDNRGDEESEFHDENKMPRTPHERRGHFRTLHSEKFRHKRGLAIWIKPQWIGPSTATVGRNRYRVILEQHAPSPAPVSPHPEPQSALAIPSHTR